MNKVKLTITVDGAVLRSAEKVAAERRTPLSRAVESFLLFYSKIKVYCFKCGEKINIAEAMVCPSCGWVACPSCESCRCALGEDAAVAVYHIRRTYEELLSWRVK
ncbi:MAG: hypothetical protein QXJ75_04065 [Candidatus Bathyarchaeia archaeon]